jgi:hypothetical protein
MPLTRLAANAAFAITALVSALMPAAGVSAQGKTVNTIMIHEQGEIVDAAAVNAAISMLVKDADGCHPRTQECICRLSTGLDNLDEAYRHAVAKHPAWGQSSMGVEYIDPMNGGSVGIVMSNVRRQLKACGRQ